MAGKTARKYFLGQGFARVGCAQAVAEALRQQWGLDDTFVMSMAEATGGQAPGGQCGAVYAALRVAEERIPGKKQLIEDYFKKEAGGLTCREIRSQRKLRCADCVEQAANLLSSEVNEKGAL